MPFLEHSPRDRRQEQDSRPRLLLGALRLGPPRGGLVVAAALHVLAGAGRHLRHNRISLNFTSEKCCFVENDNASCWLLLVAVILYVPCVFSVRMRRIDGRLVEKVSQILENLATSD